jgi:hypothetical protein
MREKSERLKYIRDTAMLRLHEDALLRVKQSFRAQGDAAVVRAKQARDAVEKRGFAGSGRAEEDSEPRRNRESYIQKKGWTAGAAARRSHLDVERRSHCAIQGIQTCRRTRRFTP